MRVYYKNGKEFGRYDEKTKTLYKLNLKNNHILWKFGTPAIDKQMYNSVKPINKIICESLTQRFTINSECFEEHKQEINYGFGEQYACAIEHWDVEKL